MNKKKRQERRERLKQQKEYLAKELQPKDGDRVAHCGHLESGPHHFYKAPGLELVRPDFTRVKPEWIVVCHVCFKQYGHAATRYIRGDGVWRGSEPELYENPDVAPMTPVKPSDSNSN